MKTSLLLICLLGLLPALFAQKEDYAVSNKGDTLWGKYRTNFFGKYILETDSGKVMLKATEYKSILVREDSVYYRSMQVRGLKTPQWCERIENGRIQLYFYLMEHGQNLSTRQVYAVKDRTIVHVYGEGMLANKPAKKEDLKRLFEDNPEVFSAFEKTKGLKFKTMVEMVKRYNSAALAAHTAAGN